MEAQNSIESNVVSMEPLSIISDVLIHNITWAPKGVDAVPMKRSTTFPAFRYSEALKKMTPHSSWAPVPVPEGKVFLEIELGEQLGTGRIGLTYAVRIIRARAGVDGPEIPLDTLGITFELCAKVAKPYHCRSLAREAWVYERLRAQDGYQGVVVPRCYGFFTIPLLDCSDKLGHFLHSALHVRPWREANVELYKMEEEREEEDEEEDDRKSTDREHFPSRDHLPTDKFNPRTLVDDCHKSKESSSWNTWNNDPEEPLLAVLLMERLGEPHEEDHPDIARGDLPLVLKDMVESGVMQHDLRWNNVLHAREDDDTICPRHKVKHLWRVIDFDRSLVAGVPLSADDRRMMENEYNWAYTTSEFWTGRILDD
ncbi:hypothetical protein QCA50_011706 [Cerrena zonata]|uniref:Uncharacterized protein n=1 Tax=Cerrena zonata TaxID=2478898 RepID=A0AAW0FYZ8_9APHY